MAVISTGTRIQWELEFITPEKAASYLEANVSNRHLRNALIKSLASAVSAGRWITTHEAIAFASDGTLIDGQHRLRAIILAGRGVWIWVARNVPKEAFMVIDQGGARTTGDLVVCERLDVGNANAVSALARSALLGAKGEGRTGKLEKQDVFAFVKRFKGLLGEFAKAGLSAHAPFYNAGWMSAFVRASFSLGYEDMLLQARRVVDQEWDGDADPLKVFHLCLQRTFQASKRGGRTIAKRSWYYAIAARSIRHLANMEKTKPTVFMRPIEPEDDFPLPGDDVADYDGGGRA